MAYGNWGGNVFKNGIRQKYREDNTPYKEKENKPGYHQAFGRREGLDPHHAVLGNGRVRLCGYKSNTRLYLEGKLIDITKKYY